MESRQRNGREGIMTGFDAARAGVYLFAFVLVSLALLLAQGCSSSSGNSSFGRLSVFLTDRPSVEYQKVVIAVKEVRVVPEGLDEAADGDASLPVIATFATPIPFDVLTLRFQQELLGEKTLPAGKYSQVRLVLAENPEGGAPVNYVTVGGVDYPLKTPSGQESVLKVLGRFEVKAAVANAIMLDFDPNTAVVKKGSGDFSIKPTGIRVVEAPAGLGSFGSINGLLASFGSWSTATLTVIPSGSSSPIAAAALFSNYTSQRWEAPFSAFAPAGEYRLHLKVTGSAAPRFAPYSTPVLSVTAGQPTDLDEVVLAPVP